MQPSGIFVWLGAVVLLFFTRTFYRILTPRERSRDGYIHLMFMKDIRDNGYRYPESPEYLATGGQYAYPHAMHWILSFLPCRFWDRIDLYFSGIMDGFFSILFLSLYYIGWLSTTEFIVALGLFLATPEFARPDQAHGCGLSGRKPGGLLVATSLLSLVLWLNGGGSLFLVVSGVVAALIALTSKFGLQALTFISLVLGITTTPIALTLPVASVILALILSFGTYRRILRTHIRHSYNYAKEFDRWHPGSNLIASNRRFRTLFQNLINCDLSKGDLKTVREIAILRTIVNNPFVLLIIGTYAYTIWNGRTLIVESGLEMWIAGGLFAYVFTSFPPFRFLGEAERYLEYIFLPSALLITAAWTNFDATYKILVISVIGAGILILIIYQYIYVTVIRTPPAEQKAWDEVQFFFQDRDSDTVIVQPTNRARDLAWKTGVTVVDIGLNASSSPTAVEEKNKLHEYEVPYVTDDLDWLEYRYNPGWVVFDKTKMPFKGLTPPKEEPYLQNSFFSIYKFDQFISEECQLDSCDGGC